jgi:class 3 adenylate cyclase/WD40 repeat protein
VIARVAVGSDGAHNRSDPVETFDGLGLIGPEGGAMVERSSTGSVGSSSEHTDDVRAPVAVAERRTFFIADVRGYSTFTRERGDAAAAILAQRFADLARDAVEARSGRVLELRGDEAFAVFESTPQAVRAAIDVQATFAEESRSDPAFQLPVGIGIDVGEAVPVEGGYRGAAVNMAARLCSSAAAGQVLVTRGVVDAVGILEDITFADRGQATFKGFEEPVEVIEALGVVQGRAVETSPDVTRAVSERALPPELDPITPLIDREREVRWLRGTWRQVRRGHGRILLISGAAQIGKTRLAAELASFVHATGADVRYTGQGGTGTALAMSAIRDVTLTRGPVLLILDDIDVAGPAPMQALGELCDEISEHPALVLGLLRDRAASSELSSLVDRVDERGDGHRTLGPFGQDDVRGIVRLYLGEAEKEAPVESFTRASEGVPGRVHEVVSDWTRSEASRRLASAAEFLATSRERHAADLEFANNAIALKLGRLYTVGGRDVLASDTCPYKGLAQFDASDSPYFFGRERLVGELAARTVATGLLGVVGASGSGKSSAIAAGLVPSLEAGLLPGSERWSHITMRPSNHPVRELQRALGTENGQLLEAAALSTGDGGRLVLVVDQFEEVFTLCADEEERAKFIEALTASALRWPDHLIVIVIIRADHYGDCADFSDLSRALASNHVLVGALSREELARAIELPARRVGVRIDSALVEALVDEVALEPGGLPLLSTALVELWRSRDSGWIRMHTFERTGGVRGAVARLAEASYSALSEAEQLTARRIFLRLVVAEDGEAINRRRASLDEFDVDKDPAAAAVIARMTQDRLLTVGDGTVEVSHEALLREWPRLRGWLDEDVQGRQLHAHLTEAARQWTASGEDPADLYRGARLVSAVDWTAEHTVELNARERKFLERSRQATQADVQRTRRTNRRLRASLVGVATFLVVALIGGSLALQQRSSARTAATIADSKRLAAQAVADQDPGESLRLALAGLSIDDSVDTRSALLQVLQREPSLVGLIPATREVGDVAITPDGGTLIANEGGSLDFYGTDSQAPVADPMPVLEEGSTLAVDHGGRTVAFLGKTSGQSYLGFVDARTHDVVHRIPFRPGIGLMSAGFSPNGQRLAVATGDWGPLSRSPRKVFLFDRATARRVSSLKVGTFSLDEEMGTGDARHWTAIAYLPDGRLAVSWFTGGQFEGGTAIWNLRSHRPVQSFSVGGPALAVSRDGQQLAVGEITGRVAVIDLASGMTKSLSSPHTGPVTDVAFTADGQSVISSGNDGQIKSWDVTTGLPGATLPGSGSLAVTPDGRTLFLGGPGSSITAWDLSGARGLAQSVNIGSGYPQFDVDGTDGLVAYQLPGGGGTQPPKDIGLWNPETGRTSEIPSISGQTCYPAFSPDGSLVMERCDGDYLWRTRSNNPRPSIAVWAIRSSAWAGRVVHAKGAVWAGAFSPDGRTFATSASEPRQVRSPSGIRRR